MQPSVGGVAVDLTRQPFQRHSAIQCFKVDVAAQVRKVDSAIESLHLQVRLAGREDFVGDRPVVVLVHLGTLGVDLARSGREANGGNHAPGFRVRVRRGIDAGPHPYVRAVPTVYPDPAIHPGIDSNGALRSRQSLFLHLAMADQVVVVVSLVAIQARRGILGQNWQAGKR